MEESRLKPMKEGYDQDLFKDLFKRTKALRNKLSKEIDHRRFGVDHEEIVSWFDVKFIYVFNKYQDKHTPEVLLGHIINALKMFKYRVMRSAYTNQFSQNIMSTEDVFGLEDMEDRDHEFTERVEKKLEDALDYIKKQISDNAFLLLELQLNPPPYIQAKLREKGIHNFTRIPNSLFAEYLELGSSSNAIKLIEAYKKEISFGTIEARQYFQLQS